MLELPHHGIEYQTCWIAGVKSEERNDLRDEEKCLETKLGQIVFVEEPGTIFCLMMNISGPRVENIP